MPLPLDRSRLAVHQLGRGDDAPTVLLMHGLGDSGLAWPDAVSRWGGRYRLLAVDARGHGRSPRFTAVQLDEGAGDVMVADTLTLLEDLSRGGVEPPALVGHSMGAAVAAAAAAEAPELVRALVLEDPAWRRDLTSWAGAERAAERVAAAERARRDVAAEERRGRLDNPTWPEVELGPWAESTTQTDHAFLALDDPLPSTPWSQVAKSLRVPTLLVTGTSEVIVDAAIRLELGDLANPALQIAVVEGAGHCVRRDRPEGYHAVVDPFLAACLEGATGDEVAPDVAAGVRGATGRAPAR